MSTRWLFCASAGGFTVTSLLCGWAWDIQSMIVFRGVQGFLGGSMIPTVFTTAFVYFAGQQRVIAVAVIGSISSLAPTLGPAIGGGGPQKTFWARAFLHQSGPWDIRRRRGADARAHRSPEPGAAARRRLSGHRTVGALSRLPRIYARGGTALGLVRRRDNPHNGM